MPAQNLYFSDDEYRKILSLADDLNLPTKDTLHALIEQGLLFYERHFKEILEEEVKTLTEKTE